MKGFKFQDFKLQWIVLFFVPCFLFAQEENKDVEILNADLLKFTEINGKKFTKLIGNVQLKQDEVFMFCDSALLDKDNSSDNMNINFQPVFNVIGVLLMLLAFGMFITAGVAAFNISVDYVHFIQSGIITFVVGLIFWLFKFNVSTQVNKREGYLIVALGWIFMSGFGALPFYISGVVPSYADAVFESVSGFTTTGATIFNDIEILGEGMLFWRSLTHWIGGMGIKCSPLHYFHCSV